MRHDQSFTAWAATVTDLIVLGRNKAPHKDKKGSLSARTSTRGQVYGDGLDGLYSRFRR